MLGSCTHPAVSPPAPRLAPVFSKDVTTPATLGTIVGAGTDHKKIILTMAIRFSITPVAKGEGEDADEC
jgi:hypothetical protein